MKLEVECHHCKGTGKIPLADGLAFTLELLEVNGPLDASMVQNRTPNGDCFGLAAFCNRLKALHLLGLVTRERAGRQWLYKARSTAHARKAGAKGARVRWKGKK